MDNPAIVERLRIIGNQFKSGLEIDQSQIVFLGLNAGQCPVNLHSLPVHMYGAYARPASVCR